MRVLLVDDEEELVSALGERLVLRNIEAEWFTTGSAALRRVASCCFDLAILDMKMPKIGGLELREKLRARCPDMKFIFLTGYGSEKDFASARGTDADYMVKPVDIERLLDTMQTLFNRSKGDT
ncbi:MAG: response regulator [Deltaproteobacteria bacterium]|nr:response regulator [Deltaproteobacteria bacterium]